MNNNVYNLNEHRAEQNNINTIEIARATTKDNRIHKIESINNNRTEDKKEGIEVYKGEIWMARLQNLDEDSRIQRGERPIVIISNNVCNRNSTVINYLSITTKKKHPLPTHVAIGKEYGLRYESTILCEQTMSLDNKRLLYKVSECDKEMMDKIEEGLRKQLDIKRNYEHIENQVEAILNLEELLEKEEDKRKVQKLFITKNLLEEEVEKYCKEKHIDFISFIDNKRNKKDVIDFENVREAKII